MWDHGGETFVLEPAGAVIRAKDGTQVGSVDSESKGVYRHVRQPAVVDGAVVVMRSDTHRGQPIYRVEVRELEQEVARWSIGDPIEVFSGGTERMCGFATTDDAAIFVHGASLHRVAG